ncbi:MAG: zf-HC2 domain-containing protein [Steroidobacteraceae bacterium]
MNRPPERQLSTAAHEEWELRLQEWLDGTATAAEAAAVQNHLASCDSCTQLARALRSIDETLAGTVPAEPKLGSNFDAQLFSRIAADDAARQRDRAAVLESAPREELAALHQAWRRSLVRIVGVAFVVAVALIWIIMSGAVPFLSPATIAVTVANVTPLQWLSIGLIGGAAAMVLTRWLQST